jgi:BolA protein
MTRQDVIAQKLTEALAPTQLHVENESYKHSVPKGSETHFKVTLVSAAFEGLSTLERHRRVHAILAEELQHGVHALTLRLSTPEQSAASGQAPFTSPPCLGGGEGGEP